MSGSQEMYYVDDDGTKQDADLHDEMLDGVDGSDSEVASNLEHYIKSGQYSEATAFSFFGTPGGIKLYQERRASGIA